jgi:hypothetical protein
MRFTITCATTKKHLTACPTVDDAYTQVVLHRALGYKSMQILEADDVTGLYNECTEMELLARKIEAITEVDAILIAQQFDRRQIGILELLNGLHELVANAVAAMTA